MKSSLNIVSNKIKTLSKENYLIISMFILSTLFFLVQHYFNFSWDFAAYLINAKYFFYGGNYFEVYRAPIISLILGPLLLFGKMTPYLYILLVSILFLYSTKKLSDALFEKYFYKYKIEKSYLNVLFYFFNLNIFVLIFGIIVGTEMLALSFFQIFLAYFILNKNSGHLLGLAFLTRYNFFIFLPFLLFNKSIKKIMKNLGLFFIVLFPWVFFNKIHWGNWFTSIADSFYLNILSRLDRVQPFQFSSLIDVANWLIPLVVLGVIISIRIFFKTKDKKLEDSKYPILFALIFLLFLYDIYSVPFKITRYMFNLILPISFFSTIGAIFISKTIKKRIFRKVISLILSLIFLVSLVTAGYYTYSLNDSQKMYYESAQEIKILDIEECQVLSTHWVPVNYYSGNVRFMASTIQEGLDKNDIMLIFYQHPTMDDKFISSEIDNYPQLAKTNDFVIIADRSTTKENCIKSKGYSSPMRQDSCEILSKKFKVVFLEKIFQKACEMLNA